MTARQNEHDVRREDRNKSDEHPLPPSVQADEFASWNALASTLIPVAGRSSVSMVQESSSPLPQQIGRFRIVRLIGRGGMGTVYEAEDTANGARVALKTLRRDVGAEIRRFLAEFHTLANLRHVNLVRIFELGNVGGEPFFTMELLHGVNLRQWIGAPAAGGLSSEQERRLRMAMGQLVQGLTYLHRAGHLHRDLKPTNVLVEGDGTVKVLDLGLAVRLDALGTYEASVPGRLMGTIPYMSPEQAEGKNLTAAADWYSVGVMLFECLTGALPFVAATLEELQDRKRRGPQPPPDWRGPADLMNLALQLLSPRPADRPTADEVARVFGTVPVGLPVAAGELIGRGELQRGLYERYTTLLRQGGTKLIRLAGVSGIGKSELLNWFLQRLREDARVNVYAGRCYETVQLPYKALDAVNVAIAHRLAEMGESTRRAFVPLDVDLLCELWPVFSEVFTPSSVVRRLSPPERRRRAFVAYKELLSRMGPRGPDPGQDPPLLVIDDLQWGDFDSAALLVELLRDNPPPMLMIWSYRQEDVHHSRCLRYLVAEVDTLAKAGLLEVDDLFVEPLTEADAKDLVRRLLGPHSAQPRLVEHLVREAAGNPLLLRELSNYVRCKCDNAGSCTPELFAERFSLRQILADHVEELPPQARCLLYTTAVAGRPVETGVLAQAADCVDQLPTELDRLLSKRLVRIVTSAPSETLDMFHDRVREMIVAEMPEGFRSQTHYRLAETLEEKTTDAEFIGVQFLLAGRQDRAGPYLLRAAQTAADSLAFDRAIRLFRMALQCALPPEDQLRAQVGYAEALANLGRCREAAEQFLAAARQAPPDIAWNHRCRAAGLYLTSGHTQEGLVELDELLASVGLRRPRSTWTAYSQLIYWRLRSMLPRLPSRRPAQPSSLRQLDVCWSAVSGLSLVDPLPAAALTYCLLDLARQVGEPRRLLRALAVFTAHEAISGTRCSGRTERLLKEMQQVADACGGLYANAIVCLTRGIVAHLQGRWLDAQTECDRAVELFSVAEHPDVTWELDTAQTFGLWARLYAGQMDELRAQQPLARRGAIERDDLFARWNFGARVLAIVALADDKVDQVIAALNEDERLLPRTGFHVQHHNLLLARTLVDLYEGRAGEAWQRIKWAWTLYRSSLLARVQQVRIDFWKMYGLAALAAVIAEQPTTAYSSNTTHLARRSGVAQEKEVLRAIRHLRKENALWATALGELLEAGYTTLYGPLSEVAERFARAARVLEQAQMQLFAHAARWRHEQWHRACFSTTCTDPPSPPSVPVTHWHKWVRWLAPSVEPQTRLTAT